MGRKRARFEWVAEDAEGEAVERVERPNRSALKRHRKRLEGLARRLGEVSPGHLAQAPIPDGARDAVAAYAASKTGPDRRRKLLFATHWLEDVDADALEAWVDQHG